MLLFLYPPDSVTTMREQLVTIDLSDFVYESVSVWLMGSQLAQLLQQCHAILRGPPTTNNTIRVKLGGTGTITCDVQLPRDPLTNCVVCPCKTCIMARCTQRDADRAESRLARLEARVFELERIISTSKTQELPETCQTLREQTLRLGTLTKEEAKNRLSKVQHKVY